MTLSLGRRFRPSVSGGKPRRVAVFIPLLAIPTALTGCGGSEPNSSITFSSGATTLTVAAQALCVFANTCQPDQTKIGKVSATSASSILVQVPKDLAKAGWIAEAYSQDSAGKHTPISGVGSLPTNSRVGTLLVPEGDGGYFVQVVALKPTERLTTWIVRVTYGA